jgi:hypothetical protein
MSLVLLFSTAEEETRKQNFHTLLMLHEKAENHSREPFFRLVGYR